MALTNDLKCTPPTASFNSFISSSVRSGTSSVATYSWILDTFVDVVTTNTPFLKIHFIRTWLCVTSEERREASLLSAVPIRARTPSGATPAREVGVDGTIGIMPEYEDVTIPFAFEKASKGSSLSATRRWYSI